LLEWVEDTGEHRSWRGRGSPAKLQNGRVVGAREDGSLKENKRRSTGAGTEGEAQKKISSCRSFGGVGGVGIGRCIRGKNRFEGG